MQAHNNVFSFFVIFAAGFWSYDFDYDLDLNLDLDGVDTWH